MDQQASDIYDQLVIKLRGSDPAAGAAAATELLALGDEGTKYLVDELTDLPQATRERITAIVRQTFDAKELSKRAQGDEYEAIHLLGISQYPEALNTLNALLEKKLPPHKETIGETRVWYVLDAIGLLGDKKALPALQKILDSDVDYRDIDIYKAAKLAIRLIDPKASTESKWLKPYNL